MVIRSGPWPVGAPCWATLDTDVRRAARFYRALLGWQVEVADPAAGGHGTARLDGRRVAGLWPREDAGSAWTTHLSSTDARSDAERVAAAGGSVITPAAAVLDDGVLAVVADTTGARFGLWQSGASTGFEVAAEPGAHAWSDLLTPDLVRTEAFYASAFGFSVYNGLIALDVGEPPVAGIADGDAGWVCGFQVADLADSLRTLEELGGAVEVVRSGVATVRDDQGALFRLRAGAL